MMRKILSCAVLALLLTGCVVPVPTGTRPSASAPVVTASGAGGAIPASGSAGQAGSKENYAVTLDGTKVGTDYQGKPALVADFTFTNNSDKATSFMVAVRAQAFQNSVELSRAIVTDGVDAGAGLKEVQPGGTIKVQEAYSLTDQSDVEVSVKPLFGDKAFISQKVKVG